MVSDKPKHDISSTGGSNSQFLSKLRLKKAISSRNNGNLVEYVQTEVKASAAAPISSTNSGM